MTQTPARPARSGGVRRWPADPAAFADTSRCPACLTPLTSAVCTACGLDLSAPQAAEVLASGRRIVAEEQRRQGLIDGMFEAQAAREAGRLAGPPAVPVVPAPAPAPSPAPASAGTSPASGAGAAVPMPVPASGRPAPVHTATPVAPPTLPVAPPQNPPVSLAPPSGPPVVPAAGFPANGQLPPGPAAESRAPRRSGMQVFLLTLGVVLISVTAIVFLFVAYLIASLEVRSVIIALASALVLGVAALLRRRGLPGTAEGVAVVAVVLLLLDVWIVRANDLFGTGAARPTAYAGVALLVLAAVLGALRAATRIRALGISAAALAPAALFLLGVAAAPAGEPGTAAWLGGVLAMLAAIAAAAVRLPNLERHLALALGVTGGAIAWCAAAFALPDLAWHPLLSFLIVAVVCALLLAALAGRGRELGVGWQWVAAIAAGSAIAAAPTIAIALELDLTPAAWSAPLVAIAIATALSWSLRFATPIARRIGLGAFAGAGTVALFAAVPGVFAGVVQLGSVAVGAVDGWAGGRVGGRGTGFTAPAELLPAAIVVPFMLAAATVFITMAARRLRALGAIPVAFAGFGFLVGAAAFGDLRVTITVLLLEATAGLALGAVASRVPIRGLLPVLATAGPLAAALAWAAGFGATGVWAWSTAGALLLTIAGWVLAPRIWRAHAVSAATVHALALALQVVVLSLAAAPWLVALGVPLAADWRTPTLWAALIAGGLFGIALLLRLARAPRLAFTAPLLAAATIAVAALLVTGGTTFRALGALVVAIAALLWAWRGRLVMVTPAAAAIAPIMLVFAAAWFAGDVLLVSEQADAAAAAAVLASAGLAHVLLRRPDTASAVRIGWAASTGALTLVVTGLALIGGDWLPLALLAPAPLLIAALWGEPFASSSPARHLAWVSAPLAVAAWWTWLADAGETVVELFTLPVAALCLALGTLVALRRPSREQAPGRVSLIAVGLAIAVLPSVASAAGAPVRTILLVAAGAVVVLATGFAPGRVRGIPIGLLGVLAGTTAAVGAAFVHAMHLARTTGTWNAEWWSLAGLVVGVGASVWWARADRSPRRFAEWLFAVTIVAAASPTVLAIALGSEVFARTVILLPLLAVLHIATTAALPRPVSGPISRWTTAGVLGLAAFIALMARVEPFDIATTSVAVAVIGAGILDLRRRPGLGSWPALGTGLAVLLLPPLVADFTDPQLWRIVTLGVVALATLLAGIRWRLQAPFVVGGGVLLVHAIVQLWPWITALYEAVWWWLWLGIAGVLLVVIAATYERQLRTARAAVTRLAALR
ncbi:SCO7613 C-terminal domain-containing membrane protein [Agromyces silvae]|uniref:SCO7613 C-terminal domain-containing membrane protein n=1 Tax=Agromyces silvae TaxID=3388266 RepID=UPI00280BED7E|nr:hypothetical protein [Agromyces protaetiae]